MGIYLKNTVNANLTKLSINGFCIRIYFYPLGCSSQRKSRGIVPPTPEIKKITCFGKEAVDFGGTTLCFYWYSKPNPPEIFTKPLPKFFN